MTIETSTLNSGAALPKSDVSYTGNSGDGNDISAANLEKGFVKLPDPETPPGYLPQNADDGENYIGNPFNPPGGFLNRPRGYDR